MSDIPIGRSPRKRGPRSTADIWLEQLLERGYDLERPWWEMMPRLPGRVARVLRGAPFENLRQLVVGLQRNDLVSELEGFGASSLYAVQECLVDLLSRDAARISELDDLGDAQLATDGLARALSGHHPSEPWSQLLNLDERITEALHEASTRTLGELLEHVEYGTLSDLPGIGPGSCSTIQEALEALASRANDDDRDTDVGCQSAPESP